MIQNINLMLNNERLGWKHTIKPKVALEMIQLIFGFKAFHFAISKMKFGIQDVISYDSFDQFLISTPWTRKWAEKMQNSKDSQIVVSRQFNLLENPRMVFRREEHFNL